MGRYSNNFIGNYLVCNATLYPDKPVVIYGDRQVTWRQMNDRVNRLAQAFLSMGVKKGDKISFMFHNCPEFLEINWAAQKVGAIPVPMNYRFTTSEIVFQCQNCDSVVFLFEDIFLDEIKEALPQLRGVPHFVCRGSKRPEGVTDYETLLAGSPAMEPNVPTTSEDICVVIYTGGTTGFPKGVLLSYQNHMDMYFNYLTSMILGMAGIDLKDAQVNKIIGYSKTWWTKALLRVATARTVLGLVKWLAGLKISEHIMRASIKYFMASPSRLTRGVYLPVYTIIPSFPYFHSASYQMIILTAVVGNQIFCLTEGISFDPVRVYEMIQTIRPKVMGNVPTGWKKLVDEPRAREFDVSSLFVGLTGAGVCPVPLKQKIMKTFPGMMIIDAFGQTEMTPITSFRIDASPETLKERSVGKSLVETRIVNEAGRDVPAGEIGEIVYRSTTVMKGYYKDEDKTKDAFIDGWFKSGDLGYLDADGEIRVVERKKECINTGGEKVFPGEIEEILETHPKIDKVCIIGVPDETWGHSVRAVVQLKKGESASEQDVISFCQGKMAGYKRPRTVVFVDEFPLSPVGKVLRGKIKELYGTA